MCFFAQSASQWSLNTLSQAYKNRVVEESKIYRRPEEQLKDFERRVNEAAKDLCLSDISLLNKRNVLLKLARKKVAEDGYVFKKGHSRSKIYGQAASSSTPKRTKYDEEMRAERLQNIEEELSDISRMLEFKGKRLSQHEAAKNYRSCEQVTEEMMALKERKRELEVEKALFVKKARRAKARQKKKYTLATSGASDVPFSSPSSPSTSRSVTPVLRHMSPSQCSVGSPESPICSGQSVTLSNSSSFESPKQSSTSVPSHHPLSPVLQINSGDCDSDCLPLSPFTPEAVPSNVCGSHF